MGYPVECRTIAMTNPPPAIDFLIGSTAVPTVLLRHDLPDGSHHFDWMLGTESEGRSPLITFRLSARLDDLAAGQSIRAERIADHRPDYLGYEGAISGDRGSVTRVRSGTIRRDVRDDLELKIQWNPGQGAKPSVQILRLCVAELPVYEVFCVGNPS